MSNEARQSPKFPWDYDVPNTPFWSSLDYCLSRNFLQCYTASELSQVTFDENLGLTEKIQYLSTLLSRTLSEREALAAPRSLHDTDYKAWAALKLGLSSTEHFLGHFAAEEVLVRERYLGGPNGTKDMSALLQLAGVMELMGRHEEAEQMAKEVLPWLQGHEMLGRDSPQALGGMRCVVRTMWKQERYGEAGDWIEKCRTEIKGMGRGRFEKYAREEGRLLEEDMRALKTWRREREGGDEKLERA